MPLLSSPSHGTTAASSRRNNDSSNGSSNDKKMDNNNNNKYGGRTLLLPLPRPHEKNPEPNRHKMKVLLPKKQLLGLSGRKTNNNSKSNNKKRSNNNNKRRRRRSCHVVVASIVLAVLGGNLIYISHSLPDVPANDSKHLFTPHIMDHDHYHRGDSSNSNGNTDKENSHNDGNSNRRQNNHHQQPQQLPKQTDHRTLQEPPLTITTASDEEKANAAAGATTTAALLPPRKNATTAGLALHRMQQDAERHRERCGISSALPPIPRQPINLSSSSSIARTLLRLPRQRQQQQQQQHPATATTADNNDDDDEWQSFGFLRRLQVYNAQQQNHNSKNSSSLATSMWCPVLPSHTAAVTTAGGSTTTTQSSLLFANSSSSSSSTDSNNNNETRTLTHQQPYTLIFPCFSHCSLRNLFVNCLKWLVLQDENDHSQPQKQTIDARMYILLPSSSSSSSSLRGENENDNALDRLAADTEYGQRLLAWNASAQHPVTIIMAPATDSNGGGGASSLLDAAALVAEHQEQQHKTHNNNNNRRAPVPPGGPVLWIHGGTHYGLTASQMLKMAVSVWRRHPASVQTTKAWELLQPPPTKTATNAANATAENAAAAALQESLVAACPGSCDGQPWQAVPLSIGVGSGDGSDNDTAAPFVAATTAAHGQNNNNSALVINTPPVWADFLAPGLFAIHDAAYMCFLQRQQRNYFLPARPLLPAAQKTKQQKEQHSAWTMAALLQQLSREPIRLLDWPGLVAPTAATNSVEPILNGAILAKNATTTTTVTDESLCVLFSYFGVGDARYLPSAHNQSQQVQQKRQEQQQQQQAYRFLPPAVFRHVLVKNLPQQLSSACHGQQLPDDGW